MIPSDQQSNKKKLLNILKEINIHSKKRILILLDSDRTIYEPDTSRILNEFAKIDINEIKKGFQNGYTYQGFYNMAMIYSNINAENYLEHCKTVAQRIELYDGVKDFIHEVKKYADIIFVTSGIKNILENILKRNNLEKIPIIGGIHNIFDEYIVGRNEKGFICEYFKSKNKEIYAFGDTDVDTLMLQKADHATIVVNHRKNWDLIPHIKNHPDLYQISYNNFYHPNIKKTSFKLFYKVIEFKEGMA